MSRRRTTVLSIAGILVIGIALNVTGVVSIPVGPVGLASLPPAGSFEITLLPAGRAGTDGSIYTTLTLSSSWPTTATLISVTPERATPATVVRVLGTLPTTTRPVISSSVRYGTPGPAGTTRRRSPGPPFRRAAKPETCAWSSWRSVPRQTAMRPWAGSGSTIPWGPSALGRPTRQPSSSAPPQGHRAATRTAVPNDRRTARGSPALA